MAERTQTCNPHTERENFQVLLQDIPTGIQITRAYLLLLIIQLDPTLHFKSMFSAPRFGS
jgi:hypothetical protein